MKSYFNATRLDLEEDEQSSPAYESKIDLSKGKGIEKLIVLLAETGVQDQVEPYYSDFAEIFSASYEQLGIRVVLNHEVPL